MTLVLERTGGGGGEMGTVEEKILVSVRLRPLNDKEIATREVSDWECVNENTIIFKNANLPVPERSMYPTAYTFDKVFRSDCSTKKVYEEGAKEVALSVVSGINSTIFAYGQTSSGKTYTMTGITEYTLADIYEHIGKHREREYNLKFSAMEIYNESVRDLLSTDTIPLRLLDDPERGTVVEKLTEETLKDWNHVMELLSICEAQRQIGETALNETSSRSHQIIRLAIESSTRELLSRDSSSTLSASVNFVDLAGSERASQSLAAGTRLKEGCHINRSLLTLGTVIRKLSKGRNGHIPFRDSKLTRILQSSLGGNAKTAIICTMSPARSHVEQSRNTLLFASCAKEVTTNAQVNVFVSDKALVKHLQRELARLESESRGQGSNFVVSHYSALLQEKELQIDKMEKEIIDLTLQRDVAQSQFQDLLRLVGNDKESLRWVGFNDYPHLRVLRSPELENQRVLRSPELENQRVLRSPELENQRVLRSPECESPRVLRSPEYENPRVLRSPECKNQHDLRSPECENPHVLRSPECENPRVLRSPECENPRVLISSGCEKPISSTSSVADPQSYDVAVRNVDSYLYSYGHSESSSDDHCISFPDFEETFMQSDTSPQQLSAPTSKFIRSNSAQSWDEIEEQTNETSDDFCKEVRCIEIEESRTNHNSESSRSFREDNTEIAELLMHEHEDQTGQEFVSSPIKEDKEVKYMPPLIVPSPEEPSPWELAKCTYSSQSLKLTKSKSWNASLLTSPSSPWFDKVGSNENTPPNGLENVFTGRPENIRRKLSELNYCDNVERLSRKGSRSPRGNSATTEVEAQKDETLPHEIVPSLNACVSEMKENAGVQQEKQVTDSPVHEAELKSKESAVTVRDVGLDPIEDDSTIVPNWPSEFKRLQREIIGLWDACNVSLVHRTYFFLLFKGDPTDSIYMEVELRRLSFLKDTFSHGNKSTEEVRTLSPASSMKALQRERETLSRQMQKRLTVQDRESLYLKWGIKLNSKYRRLQLASRLWTSTQDMDHISDSAFIVAKLVGFEESGQAPKEMFGLNFSPQPPRRRSYGFKRSVISLL